MFAKLFNVTGPKYDRMKDLGFPKNMRGIHFDFGGAPDTGSEIAAATERAAQLQKMMYDETVTRNKPWTSAGQGSINYLGGLLNIPGYASVDPTNALRATPGYNWALSQGVNALDKSAAAKGSLFGGAQQKALTTYGQGLADQTYQNYVNNLFNVSGQGLNASNMTGQAGMNYANQAGQDYMIGAQAQAQNQMNQYNARQSGYNSLGSLLGMEAGIAMGPFTGGTSLIGAGMNALKGLGGSGAEYQTGGFGLGNFGYGG